MSLRKQNLRRDKQPIKKGKCSGVQKFYASRRSNRINSSSSYTSINSPNMSEVCDVQLKNVNVSSDYREIPFPKKKKVVGRNTGKRRKTTLLRRSSRCVSIKLGKNTLLTVNNHEGNMESSSSVQKQQKLLEKREKTKNYAAGSHENDSKTVLKRRRSARFQIRGNSSSSLSNSDISVNRVNSACMNTYSSSTGDSSTQIQRQVSHDIEATSPSTIKVQQNFQYIGQQKRTNNKNKKSDAADSHAPSDLKQYQKRRRSSSAPTTIPPSLPMQPHPLRRSTRKRRKSHGFNSLVTLFPLPIMRYNTRSSSRKSIKANNNNASARIIPEHLDLAHFQLSGNDCASSDSSPNSSITCSLPHDTIAPRKYHDSNGPESNFSNPNLPAGVLDIDTLPIHAQCNSTSVIPTPTTGLSMWLHMCYTSTPCTNNRQKYPHEIPLLDGSAMAANMGYLIKYGKDYYNGSRERCPEARINKEMKDTGENDTTPLKIQKKSIPKKKNKEANDSDYSCTEEESDNDSEYFTNEMKDGDGSNNGGDEEKDKDSFTSRSVHSPPYANRHFTSLTAPSTQQSINSTSSCTSSLSCHSSSTDSEGFDHSINNNEAVCGSQNLLHHPDLTVNMRGILVDWLVELADEYKLHVQTLSLAVRLVDDFLGCEPQKGKEVHRTMLQCVGCACMLIASKLEESSPPKVIDFVYISDSTYTRREIVDMEIQVCQTLQFSLHRVTPHSIVHRYLLASGVSSISSSSSNGGYVNRMLIMMVYYFLELGMLSVELSGVPMADDTMENIEAFNHDGTISKPHLLAASAVYLARATLGIRDTSANNSIGNFWSPTLAHYTEYKLCDLEDTVKKLHVLHAGAENCSLKCVYKKYRTNQYLMVANRTVLHPHQLGF